MGSWCSHIANDSGQEVVVKYQIMWESANGFRNYEKRVTVTLAPGKYHRTEEIGKLNWHTVSITVSARGETASCTVIQDQSVIIKARPLRLVDSVKGHIWAER